MLDRQKHELILKQILRDLYSTSGLNNSLGFKGGTCLYLFYGLNRFSIDLDFNLKADSFSEVAVTRIVEKYLNITETSNKHFTWMWIGSYEKGKQKVKIDISKRDYPDHYVNQDFYGLTVTTLATADMFSHKLCAILDRKKLQNRDLYDAYFMFNKNFEINAEIIKLRTGKTTTQYLKQLTQYLEKEVKEKNLLSGMGELLDNKQKDWVRTKLKKELIFQLKLYSEMYK